jgi:NAD-dependent protein deacetylase/lipoamidase
MAGQDMVVSECNRGEGAETGGGRSGVARPTRSGGGLPAPASVWQNRRMSAEPMPVDAVIATVRQWIAEARSVVALTGAGISTDSGIPDFRGPQGVWTKNPEAEKMATLQNYLADPEIRKRAWRSRLDSPYLTAEPNAGHRVLVTLERRGKLDTLITQNVDGLHIKAGTAPARVIEIHGHTREVVCMECGERAPMERTLARVRAGEEDPPCRSCGGVLKTATISFGQSLAADDLVRAQTAARHCDLMLAVGSTLSVFPIAGVVPVAKESGARVVIVNAEPTAMDDLADAVLRGSISAILSRLVEG